MMNSWKVSPGRRKGEGWTFDCQNNSTNYTDLNTFLFQLVTCVFRPFHTHSMFFSMSQFNRIELHSVSSNYTKLDYHGEHRFFLSFGVGLVASQRFFFYDNICVLICCWPYRVCFHMFRMSKNAHWVVANICPNFSAWLPIWYHVVHFWIISTPKQPRLSWSLYFWLPGSILHITKVLLYLTSIDLHVYTNMHWHPAVIVLIELLHRDISFLPSLN